MPALQVRLRVIFRAFARIFIPTILKKYNPLTP